MKIFNVTLIVALIISCSSAKMMKSVYGNTYEYKYTLKTPVPDSTLSFSDNSINVRFAVTSSQIIFTLKNKLEQPLRINWDDASITQYGSVMKIMHKGVKYADRNASMPATTIPPHASLEDLVMPAENVSLSGGGYYTGVDWTTKELYPIHDYNKQRTSESIKSNVGQNLSLYLPVKTTDGKEIGYYFTFNIKDVICMDCKPIE